MYLFEIKFIDKDLSQEIIEDNLIKGIELYSDLDILLSCSRQNLIKELSLSLTTEASFDMSSSNTSKQKKQDLFKRPLPQDPFERDLKILFNIETITDAQFLILSEVLKTSSALKKLKLFLSQALPLTQENALIQVICTNRNIDSVFVSGFISKEFTALMSSCPSLKHMHFSIHGAQNIEEIFTHHKTVLSELDNQKDISTQVLKMYYVHALLLTVGLVALAGAIVLMNSILAWISAATLALGTYSYFNQGSNEIDQLQLQRGMKC